MEIRHVMCSWRVPLGANEKLFGFPFVVVVSEEVEFGQDVSFETFCCYQEIFGFGVLGWAGAEFES